MVKMVLIVFAALTGSQAKHHHVVIEVNVPGVAAYNYVLGNIERIKEAFAPEPVEIEVVCHGPGVDMLLTTSSVAARVAKDAKAGVAFAACRNTIKGRHIDPHHLGKFVLVVPSGAAEVIRKQEAGWSYLKGAF